MYHGKLAQEAAVAGAVRWCYRLHESLYIHLTSRNNAVSLVASRGPGFKTPWLPSGGDPTVEEVVQEVQAELAKPARALVFAGHGEPTMVLDTLMTATTALRSTGLPLRLNTNGLGSLWHQRDILQELKGAGLTSLSVALNAPVAARYQLLMQPKVPGLTPEQTFDGVQEFIRQGVRTFGAQNVEVTCVESPGVEISETQALAERLGAGHFRARSYCTLEPEQGTAHWYAYIGDVGRLSQFGPELRSRDDLGNTPMIWAAQGGKLEALQLLIESQCDVDDQGQRGNTPLHRAARHSKGACAVMLLKHGAEPNICNDQGETPLHVAAFHQHRLAARILLEAGADPCISDSKGRTPGKVTICPEMVQVFTEYGRRKGSN